MLAGLKKCCFKLETLKIALIFANQNFGGWTEILKIQTNAFELTVRNVFASCIVAKTNIFS